MRLKALTHVAFEGPGHIARWAESRGHTLDVIPLYDGGGLPGPRDMDGLIVMGGPMGVYDDERYPWLTEEKGFLQSAMAAGTPMLGLCLGAQLMAHVLGAKVGKSPEREIGFHPISRTPHARDIHLFADFPDLFGAFHWHGDAFDIPRHGVPLFQSQGCPTQGFMVGESILGLQFHMEITLEGIEALLTNARDDLTPDGPFVQKPDDMHAAAGELLPILHGLMDKLLDRFFI